MTKIKQLSIAFAAALMAIMPFAASAHDDKDRDNDNDRRGEFRASVNSDFRAQLDERFRVRDLDKILDERNNVQVKSGTVTAVGTKSFTLMGRDGVTYSVNTSGSTIMLPFKGAYSLGQVQVNDSARVKGTVNGTTITAKSIVIVPANKQPAKATGTITAVSGNTVTLQTKGDNTVTVNTSGATVTKADGTVGSTADVQVGTNVKVKGLWDSVVGVFNAIKISLRAII